MKKKIIKIPKQEDIRALQQLIGVENVITDPDTLKIYNEDWMGRYKGKSEVAVFPRSTEDVSKVLKYCNERGLSVVPQGGNTGLVGGSVPLGAEVVLGLGRMNKVSSFDPLSGILVCEAGCILQALDEYLEDRGHAMPLDLGAKGTCQIGGNVATNAGGIRFIRYGSLRGTVLGLEVVLANGRVLDLLTALRKDNTGYDLKQLFIGSEGTLGVVTRVAMLTPARAKAQNVAVLGVSGFDRVQETLRAAKAELGEVLSAFEFWDRSCMGVLERAGVCAQRPLEEDAPFYVLIETQGSNHEHDSEKLAAFLEGRMGDAATGVVDGVLAQSLAQMHDLWKLREGIPEALTREGAVYKYDISVPIAKMYELVEETRRRVGDKGQVNGYGHAGDGNLHLNICVPAYSDEVKALLEPWLYEWTAEHRGSVSAEHGLGQMKNNAIHYSKPAEAVRYMQELKQMFDPNGILNPNKTLPFN